MSGMIPFAWSITCRLIAPIGDRMKLLAFAAALRTASLNRLLIRQAAAILRAAPGIDLDLADFREFEMPMYDGDLETRDGIPPGGVEFIRRI